MKTFYMVFIWLIIKSLHLSSVYAKCKTTTINVTEETRCNFHNLDKPYNFPLTSDNPRYKQDFLKKWYNTVVFINSSFIPTVDRNTFDVQLENVTELSIISSQIVNITSLTKFPNLNVIDLSNNSITSLKISVYFLIRFISINASFNYIENIEKMEFGNTYYYLRKFDISHNRINTITNVFSRYIVLEELYLSHNNISLNVNEISPFTFQKNLVILDLSNNNISTLHAFVFWNNNNLQKLDLSGNFLSELPFGIFRNLKNLTSLNLSRNKLKAVDIWFFMALNSLKTLNLGQNEIVSIDYNAFHNIPKLNNFYINNNKIKKIKVKYLLTYTKLKTINLDRNDIECLNLINIIRLLKKENIEVAEGSSNYSYSVNGISCNYLPTNKNVEVEDLDQPWKSHIEKIEFILKDIQQEIKRKPDLNKTDLAHMPREIFISYSTFNLIFLFFISILLVFVYKVLYNLRPHNDFTAMHNIT